MPHTQQQTERLIEVTHIDYMEKHKRCPTCGIDLTEWELGCRGADRRSAPYCGNCLNRDQ